MDNTALFRWVKASEKLPEKAGWYSTKQNLQNGQEYLSGSFWNGYFFNDETDNNNFEWLEEYIPEAKNRKQIMGVLISHFGKKQTNMKLQIVVDEIIKRQAEK